MRQIVRRVIDRKGRVKVLELPEPHIGADQVLVQNGYSLISTGTEMSTLAKTPSELVRQTLSDPWMRKVVQQTLLATGIGQTARRVWHEMVVPREIGYSGAGKVLAVGEHVEGLRVGDTVAFASCGHAELVAPAINHVVAVPEEVDLRHAAFVTVGGIAVQSLRRAELEFGEVVVVYGLGLVGQLCAAIAKAAGCVVIGIDLSADRLRLAKEQGVDLVIDPRSTDAVRRIMDFTGKEGADATIICASSKSEEIINRSMEMTRRQGRVVIVGYVKLDIHPKNFLYREIDLRYSRAYGPGSYHRAYEKGRVDYPFGYVRWTEKRNLGEFIRLIASGSIDLEPLISDTYRVEQAQDAFDAIAQGKLQGVAALIDYDLGSSVDRSKTLAPARPREKKSGELGISVIGCGNHVLSTHLPFLQSQSKVKVRYLASATGKNASTVAQRVGAHLTTDLEPLLADPETDGVMICSSQAEHFEHLLQCIDAGKPIFMEKPMVMRLEQFRTIYRRMEENPVPFTLGLNRRYSPLVKTLRDLLDGPVDSVNYLIAQQYIPPDHWSLDEVDGGGRLVAESEHFLDLCHLLVGQEPLSVYARALGTPPDDLRKLCNFAVTVHYPEAEARVVFNESGAYGFPREQVTVLSKGQVAILEDFGKLTVHQKTRRKVYGNSLTKSMGHDEQLREFMAALRGEDNNLLGWDEAARASLTMFAAQESIRSGEAINLAEFRRALLEDPPADSDTAAGGRSPA